MEESIICGGLKVSRLILGLMRIHEKPIEQIEELLKKAISLGIRLYDIADIYGNGKSETMLGEIFDKNPLMREKMFIQTKCDICNGYYDCSKEHIKQSVNHSLSRMQTNYVDLLLLHRPDILMDYKEVAETMIELFNEGKVHYFGVSNFPSHQIKMLQKELPFKLYINQIEMSIVHCPMIDSVLHFNTTSEFACDRTYQTYEYCQEENIQIQAWSPLLISLSDGPFIGNEKYVELNKKLNELAEKYHTTPQSIAINWLLKVPGNIQPVLGTTNPIHLEEMYSAVTYQLTRQEWYSLYTAANKFLP